MNLLARLFMMFRGRLVGTDASGNRYFIDARPARGVRARRWVVYSGGGDGDSVPAQWRAWLRFGAG